MSVCACVCVCVHVCVSVCGRWVLHKFPLLLLIIISESDRMITSEIVFLCMYYHYVLIKVQCKKSYFASFT